MSEEESSDSGGGENAQTQTRISSVWHRWYGDPDPPFHRYCDFSLLSENQDEEENREEPRIHYMRGIPRELLRYTPLVIVVSILLVAVGMQNVEYTVGPGSYLPDLALLNTVPLVVIGVVWIVVLVTLLSTADVLPNKHFLQAIAVYGLITLLIGIVFATVLVAVLDVNPSGELADNLSEGGEFDNILYSAGFWLTFLIGGHLVYDMILRTENMFSKLPKKHPPIIELVDEPEGGQPDSSDRSFFEILPPGRVPEEGHPGRSNERDTAENQSRREEVYRNAFLDEFSDSLDNSIDVTKSLPGRSYSIETSHVFGILFVMPFFVAGLTLRDGSVSAATVDTLTKPSEFLISTVPTVLVFVNAVAVFQFFVVIYYFHRLLADHSPNNESASGFTLKYQPRHPDGNAGFRDMGQFAARVNLLLILGGLYLAQRFYVGSLPQLPDSSLGSPEMMAWIFNSIGPFVVYLFAVIVWLYFSFWQLHKTMRRGRERRIKAAVEANGGNLPDGKQDFKNAPLWPLNIRVFFSILVGDLLPLVTLLPLLPGL